LKPDTRYSLKPVVCIVFKYLLCSTGLKSRLLHWRPYSTRPPGRPRKHWIDNIQEAVQSRGSTLAEVDVRWSKMLEKLYWQAFRLHVKRHKIRGTRGRKTKIAL